MTTARLCACAFDVPLHHTCENRVCVNPGHLVVISKADHIREHGWPGDNCQAAKTHCPAGHPYDEANTYRPPGRPSERLCRACRRLATKRWHDKRKEEAA